MDSRKKTVITTIVILLGVSFGFLALLFVLIHGSYSLYTAMDRTTFPDVSPKIAAINPEGMPEAEKGAMFAESIISQLEREMHSAFGWSVNDLLPTRWLDNRANRQRGVIFAVRMLMDYFSTEIAKYGKVDKEDEDLYAVRTKCFAYVENKWIFASSESRYGEGIDLVRKYEKDLRDGSAVYNLRTDDITGMLDFVVGGKFLDQVIGKLIQPNEEVSHWEIDDRVYYAQGAALVVRDFVTALVKLYPDILEKGGQENFRVAIDNLDKIAVFDPIYTVKGQGDSLLADHRAKIARYFYNVKHRLEDVSRSYRS